MAPKSSKKSAKGSTTSNLAPIETSDDCVVMEEGTPSLPESFEYRGSVFCPSDALHPSFSRPNILPTEYEQFLKNKGYVPAGAEMLIPEGGPVRVDWTSPGWVSVYEAAFRGGGMFPLSKLMSELIRSTELMPFQLLPSVWRIIHSVEYLNEKFNKNLNLSDLRNCYSLRGCKDGRVGFRRRDQHLILSNDTGDDKDWANRFLFIKTESLGPDMAFLNYPLIKSGMSLSLLLISRFW